MRALGAYILRGRAQALLVTGGSGLLSLLLPPFSYLSGAALALVTLRYGAAEGLIVMSGSAAAAVALGMLTLGSYVPALLLVLLLWLPLWLLAAVLRPTGSLALAVQAGAAVGVMWILAFYAWVHNPSAWWGELLQGVRPALQEQMDLQLPPDLDRYLQALASMMTGALSAAMVLNLLVTLFLARWWQALLFRPGGFRAEFYGLRLGHAAAGIVIAPIALAVLGSGTLARICGDALWIVVAVYMICGLALVHDVATRLKLHLGWLIVLYVLLTIDPVHGTLVLALLGYADSWLNLRGYVKTRAAS